MSDRNSDVPQVLVTQGNQGLLAAGAALDTLAPGQLGIFDANTHLAVATPVREFYIALGVDNGAGGLGNVKSSAGQLIQRANISGLTYRAHTASRPMIVQLSNVAARCDRDYTIRVELRNSKIARVQGTMQFSQAFSVRGACCNDCGGDECSQADSSDIVLKLWREINLNSMGRLTATITAGAGTITGITEPTADGNVSVTFAGQNPISIAILNADTLAGVASKIAAAINNSGLNYGATAVGAVVNLSGPAGTVTFSPGTTGYVATVVNITTSNVADPDAYIVTNPNAVLNLQLTAAPVPETTSSSINLHYHKLHQTYIIVSLVEGFNCSGTVTTLQDIVEEEGSGENIRNKEYYASAYDGAGPYVASELLGLAKENVVYTATAAGKYDQFALEYSQKSESGWLNYENVLSTTVAIPEADTVTRNAFATAMNAFLTGYGFETLVDDAAAANVNPAVVEPDVTSAALDGIA